MRISKNGVFDPEKASLKDMKDLADAIEEYINCFTEIMIFPDEMSKRDREEIEEALARSRKLVKKLRKGDVSVFKDSDEWNPL